jgi:hypothetical protein
MDPENALGGPESREFSGIYPCAILLGPWIIALDLTENRRDEGRLHQLFIPDLQVG